MEDQLAAVKGADAASGRRSEPTRFQSLATLVRGDPARTRAAATFAVRFLVTVAVAVGAAIALAGPTAATPAAIAAMFLQVGRPLPVRWPDRIVTGALLAVVLGGGAAVAVLLHGAAAALAAIVLAFVVALAARASAIAAIARDPLLVGFIFMGGLPSTAGSALPAAVGAAVATIVVVLIALLERRRGGDADAAVAAALDGIAEALDRGGGTAAAVDALRVEVAALPTPLGSARRGQALAGLMASLERQQALLDRIERAGSAETADLSRLAQQDRACALALRGMAAPPDEQESVEAARQRLDSTSGEILEIVRRARPGEQLDRVDAELLLLNLDLTIANTVGLTRQALGHATPLRDRLAREAPAPAVSRSRVPIATSRVLALVSLRSAAMRDALRLAAAVGIAVAAIELLPIDRGYWVMMTAVIALRASTRTTAQIGRNQVIGTVAGFALALVPLALGPSELIQGVIAVGALFLFAFAIRAGAMLLGPAAMTVVFVMGLGLITGSGFVIGGERVVDVALGIGIAVIAAAVVWPGGRERLTARALAESFATAAELVRVTGAWLVHRASDAGTSMAWQAALAAGARSEEALTALAAEPDDAEADYGTAVRLHAIATRIRFHSGAALRNTDRFVPGETGQAEDLDAEVELTAGRLNAAASTLSAGESGRARIAPSDDEAGELRAALERRADLLRAAPADAEAEAHFVYAALVWHWLQEVAREAAAAEALVGRLTPVGSA